MCIERRAKQQARRKRSPTAASARVFDARPEALAINDFCRQQPASTLGSEVPIRIWSNHLP